VTFCNNCALARGGGGGKHDGKCAIYISKSTYYIVHPCNSLTRRHVSLDDPTPRSVAPLSSQAKPPPPPPLRTSRLPPRSPTASWSSVLVSCTPLRAAACCACNHRCRGAGIAQVFAAAGLSAYACRRQRRRVRERRRHDQEEPGAAARESGGEGWGER